MPDETTGAPLPGEVPDSSASPESPAESPVAAPEPPAEPPAESPVAASESPAESPTAGAEPPAERRKSRSGSKRISRKAYRRRRRIVWGLVITSAVVLVLGAWIGLRLWQAYGHLTQGAQSVQTLSESLKEGDAATARTALVSLQQESTGAYSAAHDFLWSQAEHLPWIGPNLTAVRTIADSVDALAWGPLPPLVEVAGHISPKSLLHGGGTEALTAIRDSEAQIDGVTDAIADLERRLDALDRGSLLEPVAQAVAQFDTKLDKVTELAATARKAVQLVPPMLGLDGKRTYLVVFQNLAETRATGGIFGAYAVVTADAGTVTITKQGATSGDIKKFEPPAVTLPAEERDLYTDRPAEWPMDVNLSPDFPTAAKLIREMYRQTYGLEVDGVIATDPVALAHILRGTGPVHLPNGITLDSDTAVRYLLADVYASAESSSEVNQISDAVFKEAATAVFSALLSGQGSAGEVFRGLQTSASERRLLVWSEVPAEQQVLSGTVLGGTLPQEDGATPLIGVFLNGTVPGKIDFYLRESVAARVSQCSPDGRATIETAITLTSTAPTSGLTEYVTGVDNREQHLIRTNVMVFAPSGGTVSGASLDGEPVFMAEGTERGRHVSLLTVSLAPGETKTLTVQVVSGDIPPPGMSGFAIRTTPLTTAVPVTVNNGLLCLTGR